jgi:2-polyprenyl-3-methyl-5-hydroxy-6-metoxy-1,4-benzoquinol methylase
MAEEFNLKYTYTYGDLNGNWTATKADVIFCFEVIEHLLNPLYFLKILKRYCWPNTQIFLSYPQNPRFLKGECHFHEFTDREFKTLLVKADYRIVKRETYPGWHDWGFYFSGFRPILRFAAKATGASRDNLFLLK